jgi:hypothetical protein
MKAVAAPSRAITHIQNTAPGPPTKMALATPAKLPVPTLEERLMAKAWKEETDLPFPSLKGRGIKSSPFKGELEGVHRFFSIVGSIVNCTAFKFQVK